MISGVVTLQNAGKEHTPEIATAITIVCIFQLFTRRKKKERPIGTRAFQNVL